MRLCFRHTLCAVEMSANNKISMHDTRHRIRYGHIASKDHTDRIIDVTCSESLEIAATSSDDKTIRIWSDRNELLKLLEINAIADFLTFSSLRCDIVFSAGKHLYRLPYENCNNFINNLFDEKVHGKRDYFICRFVATLSDENKQLAPSRARRSSANFH